MARRRARRARRGSRRCTGGPLRLAVLLALLGGSIPVRAQEEPAAPAETAPPPPAWVRGELRVNFRAAPTPQSTPLGVVTTGDEVRVLERRGGWARVEVAGGSAGWLPESYLDPEPPPHERVARMEAELAALREELAGARREIDSMRRRSEELVGRDREREERVAQLEEENRDLRAGERWPYMVTGASILGAGITAGFLMRGGASRRSSSRIRF